MYRIFHESEGGLVSKSQTQDSKTDCNNYRRITILSCPGKLFTGVLNEQLYTFCEKTITYYRIFKLLLERGTPSCDFSYRLHCLC